MKAIFVESLNGYLAKGPEDRMLWTPLLDKQLFKLLSCAFGGVCICSAHTWDLLPKSMKCCEFRKFIIAEKAGPKSLGNLNKLYPNAVLIGGPTFLKAAYDAKVIDTFIVTTVNVILRGKTKSKYENPFIDVLLNASSQCEISFPKNNMVVRVYK